MKKKIYQQPEMQVEKFEQADIICTSGFPSAQNEAFGDGDIDGWY